ncbi:MAG: hypothetical protein HY235_19860 [Acidobacteria bacterium]|nr:hypothetical protein [Acidobacteriota bacterium]
MCPAADFFSGMAARALIGQRNFTAQTPGASDTLMGAVSGLAYANGMLIAVDDNRVSASPQNNRVLIYFNVHSFLPTPTQEIPVSDQRCPVCVGQANVVIGQPDFAKSDIGLSERSLNHPTGVATDGRILVIADTDNNRVLIWRSIPTVNHQPADVVLGQPDFKTNLSNEGRRQPSNRSLSGPQAAWIQGSRLYVADTINNRVLIWRNIPTQNFAPADVVLGQPDFTSFVPPDLRVQSFEPKASTLFQPVSVTSDGRRLYVTDLGYNRALIWNSIPDSNAAPADVVVGQPDMTSGESNGTKKICQDEHTTNDKGEDIAPQVCRASLSFPRYALSDGTKLFIADGGNDRVLVYNQIPTQNGQSADSIIGQIAGHLNQVSDGANPLGRGSSDSVATPMGLAWDGTNLFVSDPFRRRVLVFAPGETYVPYTGVRNLFSRAVYAVGTIAFSGTAKQDDEVTVTIGDKDKGGREYKYKIAKDDTFAKLIVALAAKINEGAGDPDVFASANPDFLVLVLTARRAGEEGNDIPFSTSTSTSAQIQLQTSGANLAGGQDAAKIAPGTLVTILGQNLANSTASAPENADPLPRELAGVQVYFDGIRAPLLYVSPDEIRAQVPWEVNDANSINAYVRIMRPNGTVQATAAVAVPIISQNPGILAEPGTDPRPGMVYHFSSSATGTISVDGTAKEGDRATVILEDRQYTYTVKANDTLTEIRDGLISLINENPDEKVVAFPAGVFTRIRLRAKVQGPAGNGITIAANVNNDAQVILTATNSELCCANTAGARVTEENPALPGQTIIIYGTGLGLVNPDDAKYALATGFRYKGPELNRPDEFVSSLAGGKTANVLYSGMAQNMVGVYEVHLELNSDLPTNPQTQVTIAQDIYVSNIVTIPIRNPKEESPPKTEERPARRR